MNRACLLVSALATLTAAASDLSLSDPQNWWTEGGEKTWFDQGRLHVNADNPKIKGGAQATVWCKSPLPANFRLTIDAHVVSSTPDANNINLFLCYSDPTGKPLFDTRTQRKSAAYKLYHDLTGYIVTFVNDAANQGGKNPDGTPKARVRLRRCPGFQLLAETFADRSEKDKTYHLEVLKRNGELTFLINSKPMARATDPHPLQRGLLGLRTYRTTLWWENLRVEELPAQ